MSNGETHPTARGHVPICVLGGSAGGMESIRAFLEASPTDPGCAFLVIMHLAPDQPSALVEIFAKSSALPVETAADGHRLGPDRVHVCPPGVQPRMVGDRLHLAPLQDGSSATLDDLLRSMTDRSAGDAVVIFSGASTDGLLGAQAFREHGLDVFAETPAEAEFPRMPEAVVTRDLADFVGRPAEIAARLADLRRRHAAGAAATIDDGRAFEDLLETLNRQIGLDFRAYKRGMLRRRTARRMTHLGISEVSAYSARLAEDPEEAWSLGRDFLIPVTQFFRDPDAFTALDRQVRERLAAAEDAAPEFRVWVAGCASGEEAYSIAITLMEAVEDDGNRTTPQIFATDVDERAIAFARRGTYPATALRHVPERLRAKWFKPVEDDFAVRQSLRDRIVFAPHDLLNDPPFMSMDLIVCRNVFIYFEPAAQAMVARGFHYGLRKGGLLMLSPSETVPEEGGAFTATDRTHAIFAAGWRRAAPGGARPRHGGALLRHLGVKGDTARNIGTAEGDAAEDDPIDPTPQLVIDAERQIQRLRGGAGTYLTMPAGAPTGNVLRLIRPEFRTSLRQVLAACFEAGASAHAGPIDSHAEGKRGTVFLHAAPQRGKDGQVDRALVSFFPSAAVADEAETADETVEAPADLPALRRENRDLRRRLDGFEQEYDDLVERLSASNQELQSVSEEYRSTTEELQASQEELKSLNEELKTVNEELRQKYEETITANSHLKALIGATEFGTVFLSRDRIIRMITPKISEVFNVQGRDVGRPLGDFTHGLLDCDPMALLAETEAGGASVERTVRHRDGRWFLVRCRAFDPAVDPHELDGLVLSVVDVTRLREAEQTIRVRDERIRRTLRAADLVTASYDRGTDTLTLDGAIPEVFWDDTSANLDAEGFLARIDAGDRDRVRDALFARTGAGRVELEFRAGGQGLATRLIAATGERLDLGETDELLLTFRNVSALKRAEEEHAAKARFLAKMSHELRTPLNAISGMAEGLRSVDVLGDDKAKRNEYLDDILFSARHLARLVDDLLDIARLEHNPNAEMAEFDVNATLESVVHTMRPLAEDKGIRLTLQAEAPATTLYASERGFCQVLFNLIGNAVKYSPKGTVVTLSFSRDEAAGMALVSVIDNGPGIPPKLLHRIGTAFIHSDEPDVSADPTSQMSGLGVGLSIVDQILRAHGGMLRVHSVPGRGANIMTLWPLTPPTTAGISRPRR